MSNKKMGQYFYCPEVNICQSYGATFACLRHYPTGAARWRFLGAAAITPMIHSRCFVPPSDWYLGILQSANF